MYSMTNNSTSSNEVVGIVTAVGECCPKLQNLAFSAITVYEEIMYPRDNLFTTLVNLEVRGGEGKRG